MNRILSFARSRRSAPVAITVAAIAIAAITGGCHADNAASDTSAATTASPAPVVSDPAINARVQAQIQQAGTAAHDAAVAHHASAAPGATAGH